MYRDSDLTTVSFWGDALFQNDHDLYVVEQLNIKAGLPELEQAANKKTSDPDKAVHYSLYAPQCSSDEAAKAVREYLDGGALHKLTAKMVAAFFNPISAKDDWTAKGHKPIILGVCAMSHGCKTLTTAPGYHIFYDKYTKFMNGIFEFASMQDAAKAQVEKALSTFKPGKPYKFKAPVGPTTVFPATQVVGALPPGFKLGRKHGGKLAMSMISPAMKGDMGYPGDENVCGNNNCKRKQENMSQCAHCKNQKYCCRACQLKDRRRHKAVCRIPEDREEMEVYHEAWINMYYVEGGPLSGIPGLAGLAGMLGGMSMG